MRLALALDEQMGADLLEWLCERWSRAKGGVGTSSGGVDT